MFWGITLAVMVIISLLVFLNPEAVTEFFSSGRRRGTAVLGAFVLPPALAVVSGDASYDPLEAQVASAR